MARATPASGASRTSPPRLLLVGAGHAHLEVLRRLAVDDHPPVELVLLSPEERHLYSGMVPGYLQETYRLEEISFDLEGLARRAGGVFRRAAAVGVDPERRMVATDDGAELGYDLVSFDVGSAARGSDVPGVEEHAVAVKPLGRAVALERRLGRLAVEETEMPAAVVVVGAGAAGVEVACAAATRLDAAGRPRRIVLVEGSDEILSALAPAARRRARTLLATRRIERRTGERVVRVEARTVELASGERLDADLTLWLTGPAAPPLFAGSALALDPAGYLLVGPSLASVSHPRVFGAGDCATLAHRPETPKAGVHAVREAPVLWRSLLAALGAGDGPGRYDPQPRMLIILNSGDGKGLLVYGPAAVHARWAWWLKDAIDRRFVRRYRSG